MRADDGAVDERTNIIGDSQPLEELFPQAASRPTREAIVHIFPIAVPLRDVSPRRAGFQAPHDRVDETSIPKHRPRTAPGGQQRFDLRPLFVIQFVTVHANRCSCARSIGKFPAVEIEDMRNRHWHHARKPAQTLSQTLTECR
jgi:hypothetical protein